MTVYYGNTFSETAMTHRNWDEIASLIRKGEGDLKDTIIRLRKIARLDQSVYARMKRSLPWICGGIFRDGIRKLSYFEGMKYLVLDFDGLKDTGNSPEEVKGRLRTDARVFCAFVSPGGMGLKVIFKLGGNFATSKHYSDFYKSFAASFSKDYQLSEYCDMVTSDATRVCFLSYDPDMYYNPTPVAIKVPENIFAFLPEEDESAPAKDSNGQTATKKEAGNNTTTGHPGEAALQQIREKLLQNPPRPRQAKNHFVPGEVTAHIPLLRETLAAYDLKLTRHEDVQYGIKLFITPLDSEITAVINLYYGKKGFSVVLVPSKKCHLKLGEIAVKVVWHSIHKKMEYTSKIIPMKGYGS